jgi:hypothetical protein
MFLAACDDRSQELDERVTQLQKQLDRSQAASQSGKSRESEERITQLQRELDRGRVELQSTKLQLATTTQELARLKSGADTPVTAAPAAANKAPRRLSRESLEDSYKAAAMTLKKELQGRLNGITVGTCTLRNLEITSGEYVAASKISLSLRSKSGQAFQMDVPAKAGSNGTWIFPEVPQIVQQIEQIAKSSPTAAATARPQIQQQPVAGGMGRGDRTVVIQWPDSGRPAVPPPTQPNTRPNPPSSGQIMPQSPPSSGQIVPQSSGGSRGGLPADRSVTIQWPDTAGSAPRNPNVARERKEGTAANPANASAEEDVLTKF